MLENRIVMTCKLSVKMRKLSYGLFRGGLHDESTII